MVSSLKSRKVAIALAITGLVLPGLHKFYLRQPVWGIVYLLLGWTPIPRAASLVEAIWYLIQGQITFDRNFNAQLPASPSAAASTAVETQQTAAAVAGIAEALRHLDQLRQEGLMTEYEFEQKRRQLLERIG